MGRLLTLGILGACACAALAQSTGSISGTITTSAKGLAPVRVTIDQKICGAELSDDAVVLKLAHKHTECLAPELCGLPPLDRLPAIGAKAPCCGPSGCC